MKFYSPLITQIVTPCALGLGSFHTTLKVQTFVVENLEMRINPKTVYYNLPQYKDKYCNTIKIDYRKVKLLKMQLYK